MSLCSLIAWKLPLPPHFIEVAGEREGDNNARIRITRNDIGYLLDYFYCKENLRKLQDEYSQPYKMGLLRLYLSVKVGV